MLESPVIEAEASPEKEAEICQPDEAHSEGEPGFSPTIGIKAEGSTVNGTADGSTFGSSKELEATKIWHMRMGHAGEKSMQTLVKQGLLKGIKESEKSSFAEGEQDINDSSSESSKDSPRPTHLITAANIHDDADNTSDKIHKVCEDIVGNEEEKKDKSDLEKDGPEQSLQEYGLNAIQYVEDYEDSESGQEGNCLSSETHNEMEQTLKKNTFEINYLNKTFTMFEKNLFKRQTELNDCDRENNIKLHNEEDGISLLRNQMVEIQGNMSRADAKRLEQNESFARKIQDEEDAQAASEKEQNLITQGDDNSGRRGSGVSTGTRSKRKKTDDESDRPNKRGGGRRSDCGGRSGGRSGVSDRGGRCGGSGRGGRSFPPFHNLLTIEEFSGQGFHYPLDPLVKREDQ
ncbi:RNA polymerase-associated protein LEO1-like [Impatiens glandulifera]|uniref:RNA polymerase-associated protein LEO1-like n=1 Tax=Impatiens glandulifera TaxID=253017 RepID=UPI001FB194AA|nr:RNA polymerase-associated protein LEO1-like [Impatiens glandulifera]